MSETLFSCLGGADGVTRIASDLVDNHVANPLIRARFAGCDIPRMKRMAADFFSTGSGGLQIYTGKDMLSAHRHMNMSDNEFMAAVDDLMAALTTSGVGDREKSDVLSILYQLWPEVVRV